MLSAQRNIPLLCDQITSVKLLTIAKKTWSFIRHKVTFSLLGICTLYYCYCQLQEYDEEYKTLIQDFLERSKSNYLHFNTNKTRVSDGLQGLHREEGHFESGQNGEEGSLLCLHSAEEPNRPAGSKRSSITNSLQLVSCSTDRPRRSFLPQGTRLADASGWV